jgi:hypothetical protein
MQISVHIFNCYLMEGIASVYHQIIYSWANFGGHVDLVIFYRSQRMVGILHQHPYGTIRKSLASTLIMLKGISKSHHQVDLGRNND